MNTLSKILCIMVVILALIMMIIKVCLLFLIYIILILILVFGTLYSWFCRCGQVITSVHPVHLMTVKEQQAAADCKAEPADFGREFASRLLSSSSPFSIVTHPKC